MTAFSLRRLKDETNRRKANEAAYRRWLLVRLLALVFLLASVVVAMVLDFVTGPAGIPLGEAIAALLNLDSASASTIMIVRELRLPIGIMAILVGSALAVAGAEMQTILGNSLAEPFTLGVSSAAALGAAIAIVLGIGFPGVPSGWIVSGNAFFFAAGSLVLLLLLARLRGSGPETLILFGIALGFTSGAMLAVVQFIASADSLQQLLFWSMGTLSRADWETVSVLSIVLALVLPFSFAASWKMTALRLGEDRARSFGVNVVRLRLFSLIRVSLLAATAVSFVGIIGFVGLVGPHIARMIVGEDHRFFVPASALVGALVMSLASIASKSIVPGVLLPIGIVTALVGLPVFFLLIIQQQGSRR